MLHAFVNDDNPSEGNTNMPKCHTLGKEKFCNVLIKEFKQMMDKRKLNINGTMHDLRKRCKNTNSLIATRKKYKNALTDALEN